MLDFKTLAQDPHSFIHLQIVTVEAPQLWWDSSNLKIDVFLKEGKAMCIWELFYLGSSVVHTHTSYLTAEVIGALPHMAAFFTNLAIANGHSRANAAALQ